MKRWRGIVAPVALLVLAEVAFRAMVGASDSLAPPSRVVAALGSVLRDGSLLLGTAQTLTSMLAGLALVVAVTAEIVSNPQGLGHDLMISQETLRPERMFAVLFWVGVIGWGKNAALLRLERWLFANRGEIDTSVAA